MTNKCNNDDLDYYLKEVGDILGYFILCKELVTKLKIKIMPNQLLSIF